MTSSGISFASFAQASAIVLADVSRHYAGAASGVLATAQQVANALGVAAIGIVFYGALGATGTAHAFAPAFAESLAVLVVLSAAVAVLVQLLPNRRNG